MAIYGLPFCPATFKAFNMIMDNMATTGILGMVSTYIEFVGKVTIAFGTTGLVMLGIHEFKP
eukprot:UN03687